MRKFPSPTEIARRVLAGQDPFSPVRRVDYAPLFRRRRVYRFRRPRRERYRQRTGSHKSTPTPNTSHPPGVVAPLPRHPGLPHP